MVLFSLKKALFAFGGISLTVTQPQDFLPTMPTFTTTLKLVNKEAKDPLKAQVQLLTISLVQELELESVHLTLLPDVLKLLHHLSELVQQVQALLTQPAHQAINHQDQQVDQATQHQLKLEVPQVIHQDHHLNIQALKAHTQAPVLLLHHQMCHHRHTNLHKVLHHKLTLHTQLQEPLRPQTVTTCHLAEDKFVQTLVYIFLFTLSSSHLTHKA